MTPSMANRRITSVMMVPFFSSRIWTSRAAVVVIVCMGEYGFITAQPP